MFRSNWVVPVFLLEYCKITLRICCLPFKLLTSYLWYACFITSDTLSKFYLVPHIVYSFNTLSFICGPYTACHGMALVSHWRFRMNTSADISKFKMPMTVFRCWILFKPVLGCVDSSLHSSLPSVNRLNQTEPACNICNIWFFGLSLGVPFFCIFLRLRPRTGSLPNNSLC